MIKKQDAKHCEGPRFAQPQKSYHNSHCSHSPCLGPTSFLRNTVGQGHGSINLFSGKGVEVVVNSGVWEDEWGVVRGGTGRTEGDGVGWLARGP